MNLMERYAIQTGREYRGVRNEPSKDDWIDNLIIQRMKIRELAELKKEARAAAYEAIEAAFEDVFKDFNK